MYFSTTIKKKTLYFLLAVFVVFAVVEIWAVNRLSSFGDKISSLETTKEQLMLENQILENDIADNASLNRISGLADQTGLKKMSQIEYIKAHNLALVREPN